MRAPRSIIPWVTTLMRITSSNRKIVARSACRTPVSTASARLVFQAQPMFLNLKEFFIKRENLCRTSRARGGKLIRRVGQDLFEMPGCRHFGF